MGARGTTAVNNLNYSVLMDLGPLSPLQQQNVKIYEVVGHQLPNGGNHQRHPHIPQLIRQRN